MTELKKGILFGHGEGIARETLNVVEGSDLPLAGPSYVAALEHELFARGATAKDAKAKAHATKKRLVLETIENSDSASGFITRLRIRSRGGDHLYACTATIASLAAELMAGLGSDQRRDHAPADVDVDPPADNSDESAIEHARRSADYGRF